MIDEHAVLSAFPASVPRYTSYPTAPQFKNGLGTALMDQLITQLKSDTPVSIYLHIPFCDRLCWFCGCHTKHTLQYAPVNTYMDHLLREIQLFSDRVDFRPVLKNVHLGGGSPSLLKHADMKRLRLVLDACFKLEPATEISIEIDPSDTTHEMYDGLLELGVTRVSIGVQDFHPEVQKAINRPQTFEQTQCVIKALREIGIKSINIDALYGLPLQSTDRLLDTLSQCVELNPDRLALFGYAHMPWIKKHQKMIQDEDLPDNRQRFDQANLASKFLQTSGYNAIGIDHFAKPHDALSIAAASGELHRNFQGYTTDDCPTMIGFGASSIGCFPGGFIQNTVPTGQYQERVQAGLLPSNRGLILNTEDKIRAHIIERLMCDFRVCFDTLEQLFGTPAKHFREDAARIAHLDKFGLCTYADNTFSIPQEARAFTRIVASHFDAYYQAGKFQYSKAV